MTDQEINLAIAEACGWKPESYGNECRTRYYRINNDRTIEKLPDYCHDLNAMHEVEGSAVEPCSIEEYTTELYMVLERFWTCDRWVKFTRLGIDYAFAHATARQRAEAFLRTIGKWKD